MDEALLSYYNRELAYLRQLGAEFADKHPKIAGRLRLDRDTVEDPHVSRLIESFAFLSARIRHRLDDSFPELTEALMGLLYPDYHAPVPSMSVVRIHLLPDFPEVRQLPVGTAIHTDSNPLGKVRYRIGYDTTIYPLSVKQAKFSAAPFNAPARPQAESAQAVLRLDLTTTSAQTVLSEFTPPRLRFFINGQPQLSFRLYEYLQRHLLDVAIADGAKDPEPVFIAPEKLRPVGFANSEGLIPESGRGSSAHRLLKEFFAFPEKFLFLDLELPKQAWYGRSGAVSLYLYFSRSHAELVQGVGKDTLLLGCTPIINLFRDTIESVSRRDMGLEAKLRVEHSNHPYADLHSLERVYAIDRSGRQVDLQPFYGAHRGAGDSAGTLYWHLRREHSEWCGGRLSRGVDSYLSVVDRDFQLGAPGADWILAGEGLFNNRDLPEQLPFGPGQPNFDFIHEGGAGLRIQCVSAPTPTLQPQLAEASRWQFVTQLALQSFCGDDGLQVLKETLRLYDFQRNPETRAIVDGLVELRSAHATARLHRGGQRAFCQGTRLTLTLDERLYSGSGLYLFAAVLDEVFARYCTVNTFVQLSVHVRQRPQEIIEWKPRSGSEALS